MKTLDEVIKALEECMTDDAIESEGIYLAKDALNYLKEYKERRTRVIDGFIELHQGGDRKLINRKVITAVIDMADDRYKSMMLIQGSCIPHGFDETYDEIKSLIESMNERNI